MKTSTSIQVAIAKQMWKLIRIAFKFLKRGISNSNILKRPPNDVVRSFTAPKEYEFSCSNSPAVKKSRHGRRRGLHHRLYCYRVDEAAVAAAVQRVFDLLNREAAEEAGAAESAEATPMPGFGGTPVRQLRVTDSPYPEAKGSEEEEAQISKAADEFIRRFYGDLRREKSFESPSTHHMSAN